MNLFIFLLMTTISAATANLQLSSPSFKANEAIPQKFACDGQNINPAITIKGVPSSAKTLALVVEDPDAPKGTVYHWVMWNIPAGSSIDENSAPGVQGKNTHGQNSYMGPCPPSGTHHYHFKVYALDTQLDIDTSSGQAELQAAMQGHIVASSELVGLYSKK
jgi:Raf kinase inhibitor-like YbhB/YbcL family protein